MRNAVKKILIVDGDEGSRHSARDLMKDFGYEVFEALNGLEAIHKASTERPDLIVMDLCLPGMKADEATRRLKANTHTRNVPVLISAAWSMGFNIADRIDQALIAGAEEILYRPFHFTVLRDILRTYLSA